MRNMYCRLTVVILSGSLLLAACGNDDEKSPTAPGQDAGAPELTPELLILTGTLLASFQEAFAAALVAENATVDGVSGAVEITGNTWKMVEYSPDGELFLNGQLEVIESETPIPVKGDVVISGAQDATFSLDIKVTIDPSSATGLDSEGTITFNGTAFDSDTLFDAVVEATVDGG